MTTSTQTRTPATDKQRSFLSSLINDRDLDGGEREMMVRTLAQELLSMAAASNAINFCMDKPRKPRELTNPVTEVGMYRDGDAFFKVQISRQSGRFYAKRLVVDGAAIFDDDGHLLHGAPCHFEYAGGAIFTLTASQRLTLEEAKAFGVAYGTCCVCGALLTDPKSIAQGIGPVCIKRI